MEKFPLTLLYSGMELVGRIELTDKILETMVDGIRFELAPLITDNKVIGISVIPMPAEEGNSET